MTYNDGTWTITDDGSGVDPDDVPRLFCVNRPLLTSKLKRLPLRGMLGNGVRVVMGAIAAYDGYITVQTRGRYMMLKTDMNTGLTDVLLDDPVAFTPGLTVRLHCKAIGPGDDTLADWSIMIARQAPAYSGSSSPWWYGTADLHGLLSRVKPDTTTLRAVCHDLGVESDDEQPARSLTKDDVAVVLRQLREHSPPVPPEALGPIGPGLKFADVEDGRTGYGMIAGTTHGTSNIPYLVEAWAVCKKPEDKGDGQVRVGLVLNRSKTLAQIAAASHSSGMFIRGCDLNRFVPGTKRADYSIILSVISPYIPLVTDGKDPSLRQFGEAIVDALKKACNAAHRLMDRPDKAMSIKDAAWEAIEEAYHHVSGPNKLPANARQIMYAARGRILEMMGREKLDDKYFTQTLLPDFVAANPELTAGWDVVYDARGSFTEPHTNRDISLGTLEVRRYLNGKAPTPQPLADVGLTDDYPTTGPENRYSTVLFIEKEGFDSLMKRANIAERFDIAVMSTKGFSVTAARALLDGLSARGVKKILVMHDFDVSGFSIFGTLGSDGRRYTFDNHVPVIDIGLRLTDIDEMELQSEPVEAKKSDEWEKRIATLRSYDATEDEIEFLRKDRVELNAMSSPQFIAFIEQKLDQHGVVKIVPDKATQERQVRRVLTNMWVERVLREHAKKIEAEINAEAIPDDLEAQIRAEMAADPTISWDEAVAEIIRDHYE